MTIQEYAEELASGLASTGEKIEIINNEKGIEVKLPIHANDKIIGEESVDVSMFYECGFPLNQLCETILNHYKLTKISDSLKSFELAKTRIIYELANMDAINECPINVPYIMLSDDMALVFKLYVSEENDPENCRIELISQEIIDVWNRTLKEKITEKTLFDYATVNTPLFQKANFIPMPADGTRKFNLIISTNKREDYGSAVIIYPGVLKTLAEKLNDDIIIVPINTHETHIVPYSEGKYFIDNLYRALKRTFKEDNAAKLSKHLYMYLKDEQTVKILTPEGGIN